jgi:hypothetical protein
MDFAQFISKYSNGIPTPLKMDGSSIKEHMDSIVCEVTLSNHKLLAIKVQSSWLSEEKVRTCFLA